jgi:signal transduction histidine kinase
MTGIRQLWASVAGVERLGFRRADVAMVALIVVVGQQEAWAPALGFSHRVGPPAALAITYLIAAVALLWRRRAPLIVVSLVTAVLTTYFLIFGAPDGLGNFLPPVLALYAAGRYGGLATFWVALALTAISSAAHEWRDPQFSLDGRTLIIWVILLGGGVVGRVFNIRARELKTMARRAERLESEREERARAAAAGERARIARELHDLVGHGISLMVLQVVAAEGSLEKGQTDTTRERLAQLETTARGTLAEMRRLVSVTGDNEASLAPQPGIADIDALVEQVRANGVAVELDTVGGPIETAGGVGLAIYRLVQESLTNVIKHARPSAARVVLALDGDMLTVDVLDCGRGPIGDIAGGRGLAGMRERVALYGGTLRVGPRPEGGFGVHASFPLDRMAP